MEGTDRKREGKEYFAVSVGVLDKVEGIVKPGYHIWVETTLDGGLADHLRTVDRLDLPRHSRGVSSEELPIGWKRESLHKYNQGSMKDDKLHFSCRCKAVEFSVTRPSSSSSHPHAAYPDLIHAYDTSRLATLRNSEDAKWWLHPVGSRQPTMYFAGHCACKYCRLTSGFEIQSWVYIPLANLVDKEGKAFSLYDDDEEVDLADVRAAVDKLGLTGIHIPREEPQVDAGDKTLAGLKRYISSPGRYREFCGTCGATVFAWQAGRPDLICVAVALLDEKQDGARAEGWFDWCLDRVGFSEQAMAVSTVEGLLSGLRATKKERSLPPEITSNSVSNLSAELHNQGTATVAAGKNAREGGGDVAAAKRAESIQVEA